MYFVDFMIFKWEMVKIVSKPYMKSTFKIPQGEKYCVDIQVCLDVLLMLLSFAKDFLHRLGSVFFFIFDHCIVFSIQAKSATDFSSE